MTESHPEPDGDGFTQLWPTLFLRRRLPGREAANEALLALIEDLESRNRDLTTDYRETNLLALEHAAAGWHNEINPVLLDQRLGQARIHARRRHGPGTPDVVEGRSQRLRRTQFFLNGTGLKAGPQ